MATLTPISAHVTVGTVEGVERKILWRSDTAEAGVLLVLPGHHLGARTHRVNQHHPRSFVHVASGVEHDIDARQTEGCTVFYVTPRLLADRASRVRRSRRDRGPPVRP